MLTQGDIVLVSLYGHPTAARAELPRGAERALERYERDAAKAQADFDEAMAEAVEEVLEELADEQERATKAGDLETALAVRAKIEELRPAEQGPEEQADAGPDERVVPVVSTEDEWSRLPGVEVEVPARRPATEVPRLRLRIGQQVAIVPCPGDEWKGNINGRPVGVDGFSKRSLAAGVPAPHMAMLVKIGEAKPVLVSDNPHQGSGRITLLVNDGGTSDNHGSIRVKVVPLR